MAAAYILAGAGPRLEVAVGMLAFTGFTVESVEAAKRYRVREGDLKSVIRAGVLSAALTEAAAAHAVSRGLACAADVSANAAKAKREQSALLPPVEMALARLPENLPTGGRLLEAVRAAHDVPAQGVTFGPEPAGAGCAARSVATRTRYARTTTVAGLRAFMSLGFALDLGLTVTACEPEGLRYSVTGPTAVQLRFLAALHGVSVADAMRRHRISAEDVAAEDRPEVPEVKVTLPTRRTSSEITHDEHGRIVSVTQTEQSEG